MDKDQIKYWRKQIRIWDILYIGFLISAAIFFGLVQKNIIFRIIYPTIYLVSLLMYIYSRLVSIKIDRKTKFKKLLGEPYYGINEKNDLWRIPRS